MSGAIGSSLPWFGQAGRLGAEALSLASRENTLETQQASGLVDPQVAALGAATRPVLDMQGELSSIGAYAGNVATATNRLSVAQSALGGISAIASSLATTLAGLTSSTGSAATIGAASAAATDALGQLGSLLDTQSGDTYVFGGGDGTTSPLEGATALAPGGAFVAAAATALSGLATAGAGATLSAVLDAAGPSGADQPFSTTASGADPTIPIGSNETVSAGVLATSGTLATPTATSTGSPVRDLLAVLATVANLKPGDAQVAAFSGLVTALQTTTSGVVAGLADMTGRMGATQDLLSTTSAAYDTLSTSLTSQIGSLTSVDLATVSTELSATTTSLQASYQVIADLKGLSLANYL